MDPVSALAMATAAYNGIKKAVEIGREAQDIFGQLGKWAEAAGEVQSYITQKQTKPGLFEKIGSGNDTRAAFDMLKAQEQLRFMEQEIYKMFVYGPLQHLGKAGYQDFIRLRKEIKERRERLIRDQRLRRQRFFEAVFWTTLIILVISAGTFYGYNLYVVGVNAGKW